MWETLESICTAPFTNNGDESPFAESLDEWKIQQPSHPLLRMLIHMPSL